MKVVKLVHAVTKNPIAHDIFLEIRTARFEIPTTHFLLQKFKTRYIRHCNSRQNSRGNENEKVAQNGNRN